MLNPRVVTCLWLIPVTNDGGAGTTSSARAGSNSNAAAAAAPIAYRRSVGPSGHEMFSDDGR